MDITKGIEIVDLGLKLKDTLVISDVHIGYEEALNKQGVFVPRFQFKDVMKRLEDMLKAAKPKTIVINGDLKHEFGKISDQEWRETLKVLDLCARSGRVILVKGNHDKILGPIAEKRGVEIVDSFQVGDILILHGDSIPKAVPKCKTVIIGHEHPAVSIWEGPRHETYKCFLKGRWKGKDLIVTPSLNMVTEGTDILKDKLLSPFLKEISDFEVFVCEKGEIFRFGKVKALRQR